MKHLSKSFILSLLSLTLIGGILFWLINRCFLPPEVIYPEPQSPPIAITPTNPLIIRFNRPLSRLVIPSITPSVPGVWQPRHPRLPFILDELVFTPTTTLTPDTEFMVTLDRILPLGWVNLSQAKRTLFVIHTPPRPIAPSELSPEPSEGVEGSPTPAETSFNLDVPQYYQQHKFTCFTVAAKMALAYRGVSIDEIGFLKEIGYDSTPRSSSQNIWGDPNVGVVGTYNGSGSGGYGAHWAPVAKAMANYRQVEIKRQWNLTDLLLVVRAGNPVMVWWVNGVWPAKDISWNNAQGEKAYTVNGMHVEVVRGYLGPINQPEFILTNDPWRGSRRYSPEAFAKLWAWFNNTAVIVY